MRNKKLDSEFLRQKRLKEYHKLVLEFVPIAREILKGNLSESFVRSCVRIGDINPLTGGLKSKFVGHLRIDLNCILKTDTEELLEHKKLIDNFKEDNIFPEVLLLKKIEDGTITMVMQEMLKYTPFLDYIYTKPTTAEDLKKLTEKALQLLNIVHNKVIKYDRNKKVTQDPYSLRISEKVKAIIDNDDKLKIMWKTPGEVNGTKVPSVKSLLSKLNNWLSKELKHNRNVLVHGDCHLLNILFRRRGSGYSCTLIDPNPLLGKTDILYDYGKLLHWVDLVGWVKYKPHKCKSEFKKKKNNWEIRYFIEKEPKSVQNRRSIVNNYIYDDLNYNSRLLQENWENRLKVSLASAHLGLAAILNGNENINLRRFILGRVLKLLSFV